MQEKRRRKGKIYENGFVESEENKENEVLKRTGELKEEK